MRRALSIILIVSLLAGALPAPAGAGDRRAAPRAGADAAPRVERRRDTKGILLWGGLFLANSALLTLGLRDRDKYRDAGDDAVARGEDPSAFDESYDRAGWIVAASGAAALISVVGLASAVRPRPVAPREIGPRALAARDQDPVARAIAEIEAKRQLEASSQSEALGASSDEKAKTREGRPKPIVISSTRTQQAWFPGTVMVGADSAASVDSAAAEKIGDVSGGDDAAPNDGTGEEEGDVSTSRVTTPSSEKAEDEGARPANEPSSQEALSLDGTQPPSQPVGEDTVSDDEQPLVIARETTRYAVQVASYSREADAQSDSARWAARGYPAEVIEKDLGERGVWYRVILGDFGRSADAEALSDWLRGTFPKQDAFIVRRPG